MNAPLRQSERVGRRTTALCPDRLVHVRFDNSEHLKGLLEYRVVDRLGDAAHAQSQIVTGLRTSQERGADRRKCRAAGDCVSLHVGKRVKLRGAPVPGTGGTCRCLSANHHFVSEAYASGGHGSDD